MSCILLGLCWLLDNHSPCILSSLLSIMLQLYYQDHRINTWILSESSTHYFIRVLSFQLYYNYVLNFYGPPTTPSIMLECLVMILGRTALNMLSGELVSGLALLLCCSKILRCLSLRHGPCFSQFKNQRVGINCRVFFGLNLRFRELCNFFVVLDWFIDRLIHQWMVAQE